MTQSLPISEATSTITCGWMTVSAPMVTVSSMYVVAGSRIVTPASMCRSRIRRRGMAHQPLGRRRGQGRRGARHHEDRPVEARAVAARLEHRVAGAEPLTLLDDRHVVAGHRADGIGVGTHHQDDALTHRAGQAKG